MRLLDGFGIDDSLAAKWCTAIADDDPDATTKYGEQLRRAGVDLLELRWVCKAHKRSGPSTEGVVDAFKLAHLCGSKLVLALLIFWGLEARAEPTFDALTSLSQSFGDGRGDSAEVNFAREVFKALFVPKTLDEMRDYGERLPAGSMLGPHVERFVREAYLSFMAKEEQSLLRVTSESSRAISSERPKQTRL